MKTFSRFCCLLVAVCISGCFPEEHIWWSPKGDRAIVKVDGDKLHLVTADGELGEALFESASVEDWGVLSLSWLPDGSGFVCSRKRRIRTWEEIKKLIPADEVKQVESGLPDTMPTLQGQVMRVKDPSIIEKLSWFLPSNKELMVEAGIRLIWEQRPEELRSLFRKLPHGESILAELEGENTGFEVRELCWVDLDKSAKKPTQEFAPTLLEFPIMPRVSPKHHALAYLRFKEGGDDESATLCVTRMDGGQTLVAAQRVSSLNYKWMPDGRSLVFTQALGGKGDSVQSIQRVIALQESGQLMKPTHDKQPDGSLLVIEGADRLAQPKPLALAIMPSRGLQMGTTVEPLPDGRILFASQPITLPALAGPELAANLFLISADGQSLSTIPTKPGDLPTDLGWFVLSPDGKSVAIVEGSTDAVAVVELSTGKTEIVSPPHEGWECQTVPSWKSAAELTFAALDPASKTTQWMLWSAENGTRRISKKWPAASISQWLAAPKKESP